MTYNIADKGLRIGNFVADLMVALALYYLIAIFSIMVFPEVFNNQHKVWAIFYVIYFLYYLIFEAISGRTVGKILTKTKVVDQHGKKPVLWRIFMRSIFRFFPLDTFSYLFGETGFHDTISGTRVVLKNTVLKNDT